ncbi:MAG: hypothetical protein IPP07_13625 [Holophagales bacterium]|nr:hypothetical protein [Holophagales bacterium]
MTILPNRCLLNVSACLLLIASLDVAAQGLVPLRTWAVPQASGVARPSAIGTLGDASGPGIFIPFTPCRMVDTRGGGVWTGSYGPPALAGSSARSFPMTSASGPCPGIPTGAAAISLNITVVNTAGPGFIMIYPQGGAVPTVSTLNYNAGQVLGNAAIVPMSATGGITVVAGVSGTDLILDVNGYFISGPTRLNDWEMFSLVGSYPGVLFSVENDYVGLDGIGRAGLFTSRTDVGDSAALMGHAFADAGVTRGVTGRNRSITDNACGVSGEAVGSGMVFGVIGRTSSSASSAAGVLGIAGNPVYPNNAIASTVGVLGTNTTGSGVLGKSSTGRPVQGSRVDATTGLAITTGILGYTASIGVYAFGDMAASGTKSFIEPHPTDASRQIAFVALEGPEAGTYFRGRGRFVGKSAVIPVPEEFRLVTEEEGLTVQITPIGAVASVGVMSVDLQQIVVGSTRDVEFSYIVHGVRKNYGQYEPIQKNTVFVPAGPDAKMDPFPAHIQRRLVDLGIYKADGSVNLETAETMGWAQTWREEAAAEQAAAAKAAAERAVLQDGLRR